MNRIRIKWRIALRRCHMKGVVRSIVKMRIWITKSEVRLWRRHGSELSLQVVRDVEVWDRPCK